MKGFSKVFFITILFIFIMCRSSIAFVYQNIWLFDMVDDVASKPVSLLAAQQQCGVIAGCIPDGCVMSDFVCDSPLAGTFLLTCGAIPGNFEGAVAGSVVLLGQSLNGLTAVKDAAFEAWYNATGTPACPDGSGPGGVSAGYLDHETTGSTPGTANVTLGFYKRVHCSADGVSSTGLKPIDELFVGGVGGGGATDMTATNTKLDTIAAGVAGVTAAVEAQGPNTGGGGGTVTVDMTGVETRLDTANTGITAVGTKLDGISTKLDGVYTGGVGSGSPADKTAKETAFLSSSATDFSSFQTSIKSTPLYNSIGTFFNGVPSGGTSVFSVNGGRFGNHTLDLADYDAVWNIIKALVLIACSYVSIKIIFLGRA